MSVRRVAERRQDPATQTMVEIASLYHDQAVTQEELSRRFGVSRATVSRLLKRARDEGIVEIRVHQHPEVAGELEDAFVSRFGIRRLLVTPDRADPDEQRQAVARLVATHLVRTLTDGMIVAVGMGRNIAAVADSVPPGLRRSVTFVCAIGGSFRAGDTMNADHIARRLASGFGGESETLYAPALVSDAGLREELNRNHTVKLALDRARRADVALVGVGDLSEDSNLVRMGWFSPPEIAAARFSGTIGDILGYNFIDIAGRAASEDLQGRVIGLAIRDLLRIPEVIAVASENTKAAAILGALRTGAIDVLATSSTNARTILCLDGSFERRP